MGTSAGPNLAGIGRGGDSNLVLEMDAHDAKSYPGEPTTNIFYNPNNWTGSDWTSSSGTIANNAAEGPNGGSAGSITATNADPYIYSGAVHSVATGSLTFSCWVKGVGSSVGKSGDMRINFGPGTATGSDPTYVDYTLTDQWQRVSILATVTGAGTIQVGLEPPNSAAVGDVVYLADAQLEQKGYATPFVREGNGGTGTYNARPASVNLMIHGNVGTGSSFEDSSPAKHTITANGGATHSNTQSKFEGGSIYFDGGDSLQIADSSDWNNGANDFTWDCWIYPTTMNTHGGIIHQGEASNNQECNTLNTYADGTGNIRWLIRNASGTLLDIKTASSSVPPNQWYHVAAVRSGSYFTIYVDGVAMVTSSAITTTLDDLAWPLYLGSRHVDPSTNYDYYGYIDEARITKGTALWTSAFTPPTRRNLSAPVVDRVNDNGLNCTSAATTDTATYRVGEVIRPIDSAVWDFDGTDDKLFGGVENFDTTGPGTLNLWFNPDSGNAGITTCFGNASASDRYFNIHPSSTSLMRMGVVSSGGWQYKTFTDNLLDTWAMLTIVNTGSSASPSTYSVYLNGTSHADNPVTYTGSFSNPTDLFVLGNYTLNDGYDTLGQIANVQMYKVALTDQQIVENFNQQRNRFNI